MIKNRPPPSLAARYGNLHKLPTPTALPAAARTNPSCNGKQVISKEASYIMTSTLKKVMDKNRQEVRIVNEGNQRQI